MIQPQAHVAALEPYALAELRAPDGKRLISLAQNESAWPPSPRAQAAGREALSSWQLYSDPDWTDLRAAIGEVNGVAPDSVLCGAGSMELIAALVRCYVGPGKDLLSTAHAYAFFRTACLSAAGGYRQAPERDFAVDVDALLAAVEPDTAIVALANPANPTGTRIANVEVRRLRDGLRDDILLLVDEAYGEFVDPPEAPLFNLAANGNSVVLRTFSKAYGLAGARAGWGVFPPLVARQVRKVLNPNNVCSASQAACAAAMREQGYIREVRRQTIARRERFRAGIAALGLRALPSSTNFVLISFSSGDAAAAAAAALRDEGILMRGMAGHGLPQCLRATIAAEADMDFALSVLSRHLEGALLS